MFAYIFMAYNLCAAVNTELLIVMEFHYVFHYGIWMLFNHYKCIFVILHRGFPLVSLLQSREIYGKAIKILHCIFIFHGDNKQLFNVFQ